MSNNKKSGANSKGALFKIVTLAITLAMLLCSQTIIAPTRASAKSISQMQNESNSLQKEISALSSKISQYQKDASNQKEYLDAIQARIKAVERQLALYDNQISATNKEITKLENDIKQTETDIANKEAEIEVRFEEVSQFVRSISKTGNFSSFQILLDTNSFSDYLIRSRAIENMTDAAQEQMDELDEDIKALNIKGQELNKDKEKVQAQKSEIQKLRDDSNKQKARLHSDYAARNKTLQTLQGNVSSTKKEQAALDAEMERLSDQIADEIRKQQQSGSGNNSAYGGSMTFPSPTCRYVTSLFAERSPIRGGRSHTGVDFAVAGKTAMGEPIVAAADGIVIKTVWAPNSNRGYGTYVMIDHGLKNGVSIITLYGHMSYCGVSNGQAVTAGQQIGKIGSTGNSTGPHLHFEIRENGTPVDPIGRGYVAP